MNTSQNHKESNVAALVTWQSFWKTSWVWIASYNKKSKIIVFFLLMLFKSVTAHLSCWDDDDGVRTTCASHSRLNRLKSLHDRHSVTKCLSWKRRLNNKPEPGQWLGVRTWSGLRLDKSVLTLQDHWNRLALHRCQLLYVETLRQVRDLHAQSQWIG